MTPLEVAVVRAAITVTLNVVVKKLAPSVIEWYSSIGGVPEDLKELLEDVQVIRVWLEETGYEAKRNDPYFGWLKRLREVAYDVDDVVDEFQLQSEKHDAGANRGSLSRYMWTKPKLFNVQRKAANKIKIIKKRFADIVKKRSDFSAIANSVQDGHPVRYMNETTSEMPSLPIVDAASVLGRGHDKDKIVTELVKSNGQQEIAIISVIGLGGSGKTTFAQLIFSDSETLKNHFEFKLWVHVSQEFNVGKLIDKLFEAVTKEKSDKYPLQHKSEEISKRLNGKRFLLVLDDVWTGDRMQWEQFMVHLKSGAPESKILVTTRSRRVAEAMESINIFDLPLLSSDDSWQLFHHNFGAGVKRLSSDFHEVGKEIVKKCGGVPLAIKSLAGVLCGMDQRIEDWLAMRDNNLLDVQGEEHRVAACLRLSYSHLQYDLKQCFTICSVFPKGHKIDKQQLIDLWIAHDMISLEDGVDYSEYIVHGNRHFNSLVQICFLQNVKENYGRVTCIMHDLVHDLAQLILGDQISLDVPKEGKYLTKRYRYFSLSEQPEDIIVPTNIFEKARAVYITKCYDYIFGMALKNAKHLRSVIVGSPYVTALPNAVFQIKYLKYLFMSRLNCEALPDAISDVWNLQALYLTDSLYLLGLPESIGKLKKLRTLNLSGCQYLNRLPSIITLENLERLDLTECHALVKLPEGIWNMKKLDVYIERRALFGSPLVLNRWELDRVQDMRIFVVGRGKRSTIMLQHARIANSYNKDLSFAHTYVMESDDAHMTCLKQKTNLQVLKLNLRGMALEFIKALDDLEPPSRIKDLGIRGYSGAHGMAVVNNEFVKAVLDDLEPPSGIKELRISGYSGRQSAWWMQNQVGGGVQGPAPFPFLRVMNLINFPNLKHLHGLVELPCLRELELKQMPSLESISGGPFPSLVNLEMHDLACLGEVWMVAEWTMPNGDEGGGFAPQLGQFRVGNCLTVLKISGCAKLEVKPHLPLSHQHLKLSLGQCGGSSWSPSFNHLKELRLQDMTTLESSEIINFSGMQTELPESLGSLTSLCWIQNQVVGGVQGTTPFPFLRVMRLCDFPNLKHLDGLVDLPCLEELKLKNMPCLESISGGPFPSLMKLMMYKLPCLGDVWMVADRTMPDGEEGGGCSNFIPQLGQVRVGNYLIELEIRDCPKLVVKPHLPLSLQQLELRHSEQVLQSPGQSQGSSSPPNFNQLKKLELWHVTGAHGWELLQHMTALDSLEIWLFSGVETELPQSLWSITSLLFLKVSHWSNLRMLPQTMGQLTSLQLLEINSCEALHQLPDCLGGLCSLRKLMIFALPELTCLPESICRLATSLQKLEISTCPGLTSLPLGIEGLTSLEKLSIRNCAGLTSLPQGIKGLVSLEELSVWRCPGIQSLPQGIKGLTALKKLWIYNCPNLQTRCEREKGEDWHLISHIPDVSVQMDE